MHQLPLLDSPPRSMLLRATVALTLLLGVALLWAVVAEIRFQRRTAEKVGEDYLMLLGRDRVDAASSALSSTFSTALGSQIGGTMGSVYDELPPPGPSSEVSTALSCGNGGERRKAYFRIDLRDRSLLASPAGTNGAFEWVRSAVATQMQTAGPLLPGRFRVFMAHDRVVAYGVKYAPYEAPVAVYGLVTCARALARVVDEAVPRNVAASIISVVAVIGNDTLFGHGGGSIPALAASEISGINLAAYPARPRSLSGIVIEPDVVSPMALILMLLGTIALASIALLQLARGKRAVRQQADLVTTISHELRTPLAQILLYSETLALDRIRGDDAKRAAAQHIVDAARHLSETVSNVVGMARGDQPGAATALVAPVIEAAVVGVRALSDARAKVVISVLGTPRVRLRESALLQTLTNVLDNALKFGPATQTVLVSAERSGSMVRISVEDEGPGIPDAQREHIWTRYFRVNDAPDRGGAGIGLWVVRDIVVSAGGTVWTEPAGNGGARVVLELPIAENP